MSHKGLFLTVASLGVLIIPLHAQSFERRATLINTSDPHEARCTVSVMVNNTAEIEIRGDDATLRNVSGRSPYWRRFECTEPLPYTANGVSIRAIQGNGHVTLTQDSSNGGVALVRVTNFAPGDQVYTFDVFWNPSAAYTSPGPAYNSSSSYTSSRSYVSSDPDGVAQRDNAMYACRSAVESRLRAEGYESAQVNSISLDDRGTQDFVTGTATADDSDSANPYSFFCRVSTFDGQVRGLEVTRR